MLLVIEKMALHTIKKNQFLPIDIKEAWSFFSSPKNLKTITPDYMGFDITSGGDEEKVYPGMIITYTVSPLLGIKLNWVTEITYVDEPHYFVDEQRSGPYSFWHHKHFIKPVDGGVEVTDIVHYRIPFWIFGEMANKIFIRKKLEEIFEYRKQKLQQLYKS